MTRLQRFVLFLLAISILAGLVTGNQLYYRLGYLWFLLIAVSWLMAVIGFWKLEFKRSTRVSRSQVGLMFEEKYEVINYSWFPKFLIVVRDDSNLPNSKGSHIINFLKGKERRIYFARTLLFVRGVFPLGPTTLISSDFLGLFQRTKKFLPQTSLIVLPIMFEIRNFPNPEGVLSGGEALRTKTEQITPNISGVREYEPGDPFNRIHWLSSMHRNRLISKEFELDPLSDVWIFLDSQSSVHYVDDYELPDFDPFTYWTKTFEYHLPPSTVEYVVSIAASLTRYYLEKERAVGIAYYDKKLKVLPADRSLRQLNKVLEVLTLFNASSSLSCTELIELQARYLSRGSTVVMITPNNSKSILTAVDLLLRRGLNPIVILINVFSFNNKMNNDSIVSYLEIMKVPYRQVRKGDVLSNVISGKELSLKASIWKYD